MYEQFYHLSADPFRLSSDPRFCYIHPSYKKAKTYLCFAINRGEGVLLITGEPGTGKTTLIKDLLNDLGDSQLQVATLVTTQLEADDLLRSVAYSFNLPVYQKDKAAIIQYLKNHFTDRLQQNRHTLLIVDEAQDLSESALEELRLLTNLELNNQPLIQIFLVGQPQLFDLLGAKSMEHLRQRITVATDMQPLCLTELEEYIQFRLTVAGWQHDPEIEKAVYPLIYNYSHGIPRRINKICSRLLLYGYVENKHKLDVKDITAVLGELNDEQHPLYQKSLDNELKDKKAIFGIQRVSKNSKIH